MYLSLAKRLDLAWFVICQYLFKCCVVVWPANYPVKLSSIEEQNIHIKLWIDPWRRCFLSCAPGTFWREKRNRYLQGFPPTTDSATKLKVFFFRPSCWGRTGPRSACHLMWQAEICLFIQMQHSSSSLNTVMWSENNHNPINEVLVCFSLFFTPSFFSYTHLQEF